jgi:hypothetical protein
MFTGQNETRAGSQHWLNRREVHNHQPYCPRRAQGNGAALRRSACSLVTVFFLSSVKISTIQFDPVFPRWPNRLGSLRPSTREKTIKR